MKKAKTNNRLPSSFRDPSGFLFYKNDFLYRQINIEYKDNYNLLMKSGLYDALVKNKLLIAHKEINEQEIENKNVYKIIQPELINFISYPYEWCFSQLKDSALATLAIQKKSLEFGMSLKDASSYNIQLKDGKPLLIDTLSFEKYQEGKPWIAYKQFCEHFLAPLALMSYKDVQLNRLLQIYLDGIPLDLANSLLPTKAYYKLSLLSHIKFHSKSQKHFSDKKININKHKMSRLAIKGLIDNLESSIKNLKWKPSDTEWADYYEETNYSKASTQNKKQIVDKFLENIKPKNLWDLGANTGIFSQISADKGISTISFDLDPAVVEKNYLRCIKIGEKNILPLIIDITNPSPAIGWENKERLSLIERGPADAVLALAILHHLAISNNLPFDKIAHFFNKICNYLIIEFIPKDDSQIQKLLLNREDVFPNYTKQNFEHEFSKYFIIKKSFKIKDSKRILYLMQKKNDNS